MSTLAATLNNLSPSQRQALEAVLAKKGLTGQVPLPMPVADRTQPLPLSFAQQRLWFLWQLDPLGAAYNIPGGIRIEGALDPERLQLSIDALVARHEALRTTFASRDGGDVQLIHPVMKVPLRRLDLSHLSPAEREAELRAQTRSEAQRGFDLRQGPLLRACLLRTGEREHLLLLTLHHIVADGWSVNEFFKTLALHYDAQARGETAALAPLARHYADYACWQRQWLAAGEGARQLAYWREQLGSEHPVLALPHDRPRPAQLSARGGNVEIRLGAAVSQRLKNFAKARGISPFSVWLAVYSLLLQRLSGMDDIRIGVPVANRGRAEMAEVIGFFVNTLVLRLPYAKDLSFEQWLAEANRVSQAAQAHQDLPFEQLVEALQPQRSLSHNPLFQAKFNYGFDTSELPSPAGLRLHAEPVEHLGAHFDLALDIAATRDGFAGFFTYACDLFDGRTVEHFAALLTRLLEQALAAPNAPLHSLALATASPPPTMVAPPVASPLQRYRNAWQGRAEQLAVQDDQLALSWAELDAAANGIAAGLQAAGVGPGATVALCLPRSARWLTAMLGVLKAGAAYLALDPAQPAQRLAQLIATSGARCLLADDHTLASAACPLLGATPPIAEWTPPGLPAEAPAYVIFTSGSSGAPKGVQVSHGALASYVDGLLQRLAPLPAGGMAMVSSVAADLGHTTLFGALCSGRPLYLPSDDQVRDAEAFAAFMTARAVSVLKIVPSHLNGLLQAQPSAAVLPRDILILGGEACPAPLLQQVRELAPDCRVLNHYGPSETTVGVLTHEWALDQPVAGLPLGEPLPGTRIQVLDADLNPVPAGVTGELYIGGAGVALGYLGQPGLTAERFVADPSGQGARLYRSGDRVRRDLDGQLHFVGRADGQLKIRGYRVEPEEATRALVALEGVREATVQVWQGQLAAYCVLEPGACLEKLQSSLRECLPDYLQPSYWQLLEVLPVTANGKLDARALPAPLAEPASVAVDDAPSGAVESLLADIWCQVLKRERVGAEDNFFSLGGDSILSLQIVARARKLGLKITPKQLFEAQTVRALAALLPAPAGEDATLPAAIPRAVRRDRAPLSHAQQRLWFLWQLAPQSSAYTIAAAVRLRGVLDVQAVQAAFGSLVQRHESLRTVFVESAGEPWQQVRDTATFDWAAETLADPRQLDERLAADAAQPFDLARDALLRVRLYRLGTDEQVLGLALHHIVADGWSMNLLVDEFVQLYRHAHEGQGALPAALAVQYLDYATWQRQWLREGEGQRQLAWWREYLGDRHPVLELPTDFPRPAVQDFAGATLSFTVPAPLARALTAQAHARQATPFMLLLAAFGVLLRQYSGQADIRVGVPLANRNRVELEGLIGLFVNTQVLRLQLDADLPFAALLAQVRDDVNRTQVNAELPFEHLVEALQPPRSLAHNPLFQVMYSHTRLRSQALRQLPGLNLESLPSPARSAQFDLALNTEELPGGAWHATFSYATALFSRDSIVRLRDAWLNVLGQLTHDLQPPLHELLVSPSYLQPILEVTPRPLPGDLLAGFSAQARRTPTAAALSMAGHTLSYAELEQRANRLAHHLRDQGVGPEVCVGVAAERSLQLVIALLAILKAGGAYVPLDPDYPTERLQFMIQDSGIELLLSDPALSERLALSPAIRVLALDPLDDETLARYPSVAPLDCAHPESLAYVIYTSGSTGRPKGVGNSHGALANRLHWMQQAFALREGDRVLQKTPCSFDVSVWEFFWPLLTGACLVVAEPGVHREPARLAATVISEDITTLHFVPSMLQAFVSEPGAAACSSLRQVFCSGEALAVATVQQAQACLPGMRLHNLYGPTEAAIDVSHWPCGMERGRVPIGHAIANLRLHVLDERLHLVAPGAVGELYIAGAGLARGYRQRPGLTSERFVANPFSTDGGRLYRTGDLARVRCDGAIDYLGRIDQQVKLRGLRIELGEIETCLRQCPGVLDAAVAVQPSVAGPQLVAYVCGPGASDELTTRLRRQLPDYMLPALYLSLPSLPLSVNGKLDRQALPLPAWESVRTYRAPQTAIEQALAGIWESLLDVERVGLDDHFFERGGHSLLATQLLARINQRFGVQLALRVIFEQGSLQALAQAVAEASDPAAGRDDIESMNALLAQLEAHP